MIFKFSTRSWKNKLASFPRCQKQQPVLFEVRGIFWQNSSQSGILDCCNFQPILESNNFQGTTALYQLTMAEGVGIHILTGLFKTTKSHPSMNGIICRIFLKPLPPQISSILHNSTHNHVHYETLNPSYTGWQDQTETWLDQIIQYYPEHSQTKCNFNLPGPLKSLQKYAKIQLQDSKQKLR